MRAAVLAELGGADGITVHLREDRRHIQDRDVRLLRETVRTGVNLELAATGDVLQLALGWRPMTATLVPEKREEVTTEGGLALATGGQRDRLPDAVGALAAGGIRTSLFVEPDLPDARGVRRARRGRRRAAHGRYAEAWKWCTRRAAGPRTAGAAAAAPRGRARPRARARGARRARPHVRERRLGGRARYIEELNIGHTVISRAVLTGMAEAVRELKRIVLAAAAGRRTRACRRDPGMTTLAEFFEREAGASLQQLRALTASSGTRPAAMHRAARTLRGSAQMAREERVYRAALALESAVKPVPRRPTARWTEPLLGCVRAAVTDLAVLIDGSDPSPELDGRLRASLERWQAAGVELPAPPVGPPESRPRPRRACGNFARTRPASWRASRKRSMRACARCVSTRSTARPARPSCGASARCGVRPGSRRFRSSRRSCGRSRT